MRTPEEALESARQFFRDEVSPRAQEIDTDSAGLAEMVSGLCARDLMALKRPEEFGGPGMPDAMFFEYQESVARTSGSLAFLTTQHQSACAMTTRTDNRALAAEYLPQMGDGRKLVGIGFSQLRRAGPPIMRASAVPGGYSLEGHVPWVTGAGFFSEFLIAAQLPDGQAVFGMVPLKNTDDETIQLSEPMKLAAMSAANTVTANLKGHFLSEDLVVFLKPPDWIRHNDMINVTMQSPFALGCAQAGIDIVRTAGERRGLPFVAEAAALLSSELEACREAGRNAISTPDSATTAEGLRLRAWAIDLAARCAHAGIAASSGAANSLSHPAQRVYREALVYTVSAQTVEIMEATLQRLTRA